MICVGPHVPVWAGERIAHLVREAALRSADEDI